MQWKWYLRLWSKYTTDELIDIWNFIISFLQNKHNKCFLQTFRLLHEEGFFVGASTGLNVSAAVQVAKTMGPGHTIVTCLCDTGQVSDIFTFMYVYLCYLFNFSEEIVKKLKQCCLPDEFSICDDNME